MTRSGESNAGRAGKARPACALASAAILVGLALGAAPSPAADPPAAGPFRELATPADTGSAQPRLAVTPRGQALLSWLERRPGGGHRLRLSRLDRGQWLAPVTIAAGDSFFANWADFPGVLAISERRLVAHWLWRTGSGTYAYHVRASFSEDGGRTWGPAFVVHRDTSATEHGFVAMVPDAGGARAVWLDGHAFAGADHDHGAGAEMALHSARLTAAGAHDERALDARVCDCCPTAAVATRRGVLVAYRDRSADEVRDISRVRYEAGRWSAPAPLHRDGWSIKGCPVNGPALAARGDRVAAAWFTAANDTGKVLVAFSRDGGRSFGAPRRLDRGDPVGRVAVAMTRDGAALVSWIEMNGDTAAIRLARVSERGSGEPAAVAAVSPARATGVPQLAVAGDRVVVAWTDAAKPTRVRVMEAREPGSARPR